MKKHLCTVLPSILAVTLLALPGFARVKKMRQSVQVGPVNIVMLDEHEFGSPGKMQPFMDKLVSHMAATNGCSEADGKFFANLNKAENFVENQEPQFGILSLSAFLALREAYDLNVLGVVHMKNDGGRKYHVVTKSAGSLASCRGKKLASLFGKDEQFIDNVVADGDFSLEDFRVVNTTNPLKTVRKVIRGAANAALIDNA